MLNGLLASLKNMPLDVGKQFNVITVSFNPREKPDLAANKKRVYVGLYGRPGASEGWHFLTGDEPQIQAAGSGRGLSLCIRPRIRTSLPTPPPSWS